MGWTTKQAADYLGLEVNSVATLCRRGLLKHSKHGRDYDIDPDSVREYKTKIKKVGRPSNKARSGNH